MKAETNKKLGLLFILLLIVVFFLSSTNAADQESARTITMSGTMFILPQVNYRMGLSSYPRTVSGVYGNTAVDEVIAKMNAYGLTVYRMAVSSAIDATPYVQRFLNGCNHTLILDYFHQYPPGVMTDADWTATTNKALSYLSTFRNYQDRLWMEPENERYDADLHIHLQTFVNAIRNAGYTCNIVADKSPLGVAPNQTWANMATIIDPLDKFWTGIHTYFDPGSGKTVANQKAEMNTAMGYGLKIFNTEMGAELSSSLFTTTNVGWLTQYIDFLNTNGIGAVIWMYQATQYLDKYVSLGLQFPAPLPPTGT